MREVDIYVCIDGLGWEIAKQCNSFDFLSETQKPLETVLGFSSSAIPTILTGKEADEHGCWNLFFKTDQKGDFPLFSMNQYFPSFVNRNRYFRKVQLILNQWITQFSGYYQAYNYPSEKLVNIKISESGNIYSPGGIQGSKNIFDIYEENGIDYKIYSYKTHSEAEVFSNISDDVLSSSVAKVFVYLPDFDAFGHNYANNEELMVQQAMTYGDRLRIVYDHLSQNNIQVNMSVFSDHGMVPLSLECDVLSELEKYAIEDVELILDSTMARFYDLTEFERNTLKTIFKKIPGRWLSPSDFEKYHIEFSGQYGEEIFVLDAGVQFSPSHMGRSSCPGMHGYFPEDRMMKASFMSNTKQDIYHIKDLFHVMTRGIVQ